MVMTEQEARTKLCPVMTYCTNDTAQYAANFAIYEQSLCLASECPAWRWYDSQIEIHRSGYCGMAGPVKYT